MGKTCAIPGCTTGRKSSIRVNKKRKLRNKTLFKAPKDVVDFEKWKQVAESNNFQFSEKNYVCEKHFRESDVSRKFTHIVHGGIVEEIERETPLLRKGAVPCYFLDEKSKIAAQKTSVPSAPAVVTPAEELEEDTVEAEVDDVVEWDFDILSETYRAIKLPSEEWAAACNRRSRFIQFTSVQDKDFMRGLRIYHTMKMEVLLDSWPVNLKSVDPPKSESDLIELLEVIAKLKVCRTVINKKRSIESRRYRFF